MLLFGKNPQFFIPQSGALYVRFAGTEPHAPQRTGALHAREEFNGALARVIEDCWALLLQEIRGEAVVRGLNARIGVFPPVRRPRGTGRRGYPHGLPAHRPPHRGPAVR